MQLSYFANEIKNRLDTVEVFRFYGLIPNRAGFVCCFKHGEKTASMKVYKGNRGYHCFGCGAHGGIIDFVMEQYGLSFVDALAKLNQDFSLGLPIKDKLDHKSKKEISEKTKLLIEQRKAMQKKKQAAEDKYNYWLDEYAKIDKAIIKYRPQKCDADIHPLYAEAIKRKAYVCDRLECAEMELKQYEQ